MNEQIETNETEMRYWMNEDTGKVIEMEDWPGRLWFEIDFPTYYALTHTGAKPMKASQL